MKNLYSAFVLLVVASSIGALGVLTGMPDLPGVGQDEQVSDPNLNETLPENSSGDVQKQIKIIDGRLEQGSTATLKVLRNDSPVAGAKFFLGGMSKGETNSNGYVSFLVPYADNVTLRASKGRFIVSETFNIIEPSVGDNSSSGDNLGGGEEGGSLSGNKSEPRDEENNSDSTPGDLTYQRPVIYSPIPNDNYGFSVPLEVILNATSANYTILLDGSIVSEGGVSGFKNVNSTINIESAGTHEITVQLSYSGKTLISAERNFSVKTSSDGKTRTGLVLTENLTAGDYTYLRFYDNGEPVEGTQITVNGDSIGTTDSNGEIGFEVPNTQELTVSSTSPDYQETYTVEGYYPGLNATFTFSKNLVQGHYNTLELKNNSQPLSGAEVFVKGKSRGTTNSSGLIQIEIPRENNFLVKVRKENEHDNETFSADTSNIDINVVSPEHSQRIDDYKVVLEAETYTTQESDFKFKVDGKTRYKENISAGQDSVSTSFPVKKGLHTYKAAIIRGSSIIYAEKDSLSTQQPIPPINIGIDSPVAGKSYSSLPVDLNFTVNTPEAYSADVKIDGSTFATFSTVEAVERSTYNITCVSEGSHQLYISVRGNTTGNLYEASKTFSTTTQPPDSCP